MSSHGKDKLSGLQQKRAATQAELNRVDVQIGKLEVEITTVTKLQVTRLREKRAVLQADVDRTDIAIAKLKVGIAKTQSALRVAVR